MPRQTRKRTKSSRSRSGAEEVSPPAVSDKRPKDLVDSDSHDSSVAQEETETTPRASKEYVQTTDTDEEASVGIKGGDVDGSLPSSSEDAPQEEDKDSGQTGENVPEATSSASSQEPAPDSNDGEAMDSLDDAPADDQDEPVLEVSRIGQPIDDLPDTPEAAPELGLGKLATVPQVAPMQMPELKKERLMITQIVCENFKSYYGRHVLGPFHKSFTSIVGPNGSGKSNVIDSMLFVFGFRSQKIRSKKLSTLVHQSQEHRDVQSCTVEVHFQMIKDLPAKEGQPEADFEVLPGQNFIVSRTASRDGSSCYKASKAGGQTRTLTFKDVHALLKSYGIDLDHNRFLILQGEVEQISLMKPKGSAEAEEGMLEYLEDIIGTAEYKKQIEELAEALVGLEEECKMQMNRMKAIETEVKELEPVKDEAVRYLKAENKINKLRHKLYQALISRLTFQFERFTQTRDEAEKALKEVREEMNKDKENIATAKKRYKEALIKQKELSSQLDELREKAGRMQAEDAKRRAEIKHRTAKADALEKQLSAEQGKLRSYRAQPEKSKGEIEELTRKRDELESLIPALEQKLAKGMEKVQNEAGQPQAELEKHEAELATLRKTVDQAKAKMDLAQSELDLCLRTQTNERRKLDELKSKEVEVNEGLQVAEKTHKELSKSVPEKRRSLQKTDSELQEIKRNEAELIQKVGQQRTTVEEARSQAQQTRSNNALLDAVMREKRDGRIPGILGRLGDLGAIDQKYDVAISTCCPQLDQIVVEKTDDAIKCVEFLKRSGAGRATFICLDQLDRARENMKKPIRTPENVPRLFDLIRVEDERILPAFYFVLRDTLVVQDLPTATRIAFNGGQRWQVVTLAGEVIDQSGTMSGGGGRPKKGKMGSRVRVSMGPAEMSSQQMAQIDREIKESMSRLGELRTRRTELETQLTTLREDLAKDEREFASWDVEMKTLKERTVQLRPQIRNQEQIVAKAVPDERKRKELEEKLAGAKEEFETAKSSTVGTEATVAKLQAKINDLSEKHVGAHQRKLDETKDEMGKMQKSISKSIANEKAAERNLQRCEDKVKSLEKEKQENAETITKVREIVQKLLDEMQEVLVKADELQNQEKAVQSEAEEAQKGYATLEKAHQKASTLEQEKQRAFEQAERHMKETKDKRDHLVYKKSQCKLHRIEDLLGPVVLPSTSTQSQAKRAAEGAKRSGEKRRASGDTTMETTVDDDDESRVTEEDFVDLSAEEAAQIDTHELEIEVNRKEQLLAKSKPNMAAIAQYKKKAGQLTERSVEMMAAHKAKEDCRTSHDQKKTERHMKFRAGFEAISLRLKEVYRTITLGGDAELELVDSMNPFSEGVIFSVRPPKKSWKQISNLSGGEKTLSSLALVFALHHFKPTPFYVMDEIDAALDFKNVSIVANYIKERTQCNAQFIIISLRSNMFELADRLIGIYKIHDVTGSITIDPNALALGMNLVPGMAAG